MRAKAIGATLPIGALLFAIGLGSGCVATPGEAEDDAADATATEATSEAAGALRPTDDYVGPRMGGITGRGWFRDRPGGSVDRRLWGYVDPTHEPVVAGERQFQGHHDWQGHHWTGDRFEPPFEPGALVGPDQGARACTTAIDGEGVDACEQCVTEGGSWHVGGGECL
jgi:hypothetical protein